nr:MAG TPA: Polyhedrin vivo protein crystal, Polyhedra [Caudoviricetes sp.]
MFIPRKFRSNLIPLAIKLIFSVVESKILLEVILRFISHALHSPYIYIV